jgi:hypothetical protein
MRDIVATKPAAARVDNAIRASIEDPSALAQYLRKRGFWHGIRARPALRFCDNVCDHLVSKSAFGAQRPHDQRRDERQQHARSESPSGLRKHSPLATRNARRLLECAADVRFECDHFELELGACVAVLQVLGKLAGRRARLSPDQ